jgi:PAS domain S-box-containing protein
VTLSPSSRAEFPALDARGAATYATELLLIGAAYVLVAKLGLILASIHPSATPIWPPTGLALAAVLLRGLRVWPAIFAGALIANATTEVVGATTLAWLLTSVAIAIGNTLEAVVGGYLTRLWAGGRDSFETPAGVAKFAVIASAPATMASATIGVASLSLAGFADWASFPAIWFTWWLGNVAGALVVTPVLCLWATIDPRALDRYAVLDSLGVMLAAAGVGIIAFSPLVAEGVDRGALGFLAVLPLLWAAMRCGPRDTATVALILSCFAIWGAMAGGGPFARATLNESFLLLLTFMISITVPSLVLSAEVAVRRRIEARLRRQEQDLRAMFSQAVVGIAQADATGRFVQVNERFCEIVQRPAATLAHLRMQDIADPDDVAADRDRLVRAMQTGEGYISESRYVLPDGRRVWVRNNVSPILDHDGALRHIVMVSEDVTDRRQVEDDLLRTRDDLEHMVVQRTAALEDANRILQAEIEQRKRVEAALKVDIAERRKAQEALKESERRFRLFIDGVTDYAIFLLDPEGNITSWNMGAQRIHQYGAAEIVGKHFDGFYTEEDRQRGEPARALQVAAYEGKYLADGWRMRRDGTLFWASVVIEAVRDDTGALVGFAKITRDITERRDAQLALERAREQLAQSQKMEALGQLTGSIAHDFNNLLMIVSGHAQLLRRRLSEPKLLQAVDAVHTAASRGESLTRQLLAFSRRQPLAPVVVGLKERVEAVHEMLVGSLRGNIELKRDVSDAVWPVEIDIAEFELALVNIAVNARDAMPGGGTITLSASNVTLTRDDGVDRLEGDFVALSLTDTGLGIAPDVLPRIFEPFFTTKSLGKGTGLGLAQVYGFAQQSGGTVTADSTIGAGTTITIYLPRSHAVVARTVDAVPGAHPVRPAEGTILVVEDQAEVAEVTSSLVEQLGYRTLRAESASDVFDWLQRGEGINLVFSDVVMPGGMNGIALAQEIGKRYPHIPVLLTSGYSDMVQAAEPRFTILRKPFQLPTLEKAIRDALEHANGREQGASVAPPHP